MQNWRLENAKSPAMLKENNPDATSMSIPRMLTCTWYLVYLRRIIRLSRNLVTSYRAFVAIILYVRWRIGTDTGCAGLVLAGCRWMEKVLKHTASSSVDHAVEVTARDGCFWPRQSHRYPHKIWDSQDSARHQCHPY